jgi:UDP-N-acetylmuramoyl-tripeptide--D-alanyl-D-alanine ligase
MRDFRGATFDSRKVEPGMLFIALKGENVDGHDFIDAALAKGAAGIVDGLEELQRVAGEYRRTLKAKVIGVTGSAGKTTTKELLRTFLSSAGAVHATQGNYNNHIGLPVTILNCPREADFLVVEMGTNHPGEIKSLCDIASPDVGVVTNIGTAHLEFFGTQEAIAEEKGELLRSSKKGFSLKSDRYLPGDVETDLPWLKEALAPVLPGSHNLANAALAFAVAESFGVTREQAVSALASFELPGSRWRRREKWGATFIDDTYNANPEAMVAALDAFAAEPCEGRKIAVLGDMFELGEKSGELHRKVFAHAMSKGFHLVIGVGEESSKCLCNLAYPKLDKLKRKFRVDVSAGDLVLLKASHSMELGKLLDE